MKQSEQIGELAAALAAFQGEMVAIPKDRTAKVKMKNGGEFQYSYADLATVIETCRPGLAKHGLSVSQVTSVTEAGLFILNTVIMHKSGQWVQGCYPLPKEGSAQEIGGEITYARRYSLCAALNVAAEEDDDASRKPQAPAVGNVTMTKATHPAILSPPPVATQTNDPRLCCGTESMVSQYKNIKTGADQYYCKKCKKSRDVAA